MSEQVILRNTGPGRRYLPGYGLLEANDTIEVSAEEAKRFAGDGLVVHKERPRRAAAVEEKESESQPEETSGEHSAELDELLAKYADAGELVTRDRAEDIAGEEGIADRDFQAALRNGEILGAHKEGEAANSPWKIPVAGICQWIVSFTATEGTE